MQNIIDNFTHVLLYGAPGNKTSTTAKLFDYFLVQKPIIGICKGNEAEKIVLSSGLGIVCDYIVEEIKKCFIDAIENRIPFKPNQNYIATFNRNNQAHQIALLLDETIKSPMNISTGPKKLY